MWERLCSTLLKVLTLSYHTPGIRVAMVWHRVGMGMQHQVLSLTFADGMHNLGYITACFSCQFEFDFVSDVLKRLLFENDHFNGTNNDFVFVRPRVMSSCIDNRILRN
jgi:hypothetical protein